MIQSSQPRGRLDGESGRRRCVFRREHHLSPVAEPAHEGGESEYDQNDDDKLVHGGPPMIRPLVAEHLRAEQEMRSLRANHNSATPQCPFAASEQSRVGVGGIETGAMGGSQGTWFGLRNEAIGRATRAAGRICARARRRCRDGCFDCFVRPNSPYRISL